MSLSLFSASLYARVGLPGLLERTNSIGQHITTAESDISTIKQDIVKLDAKLDAILAHHGITVKNLPVAAAIPHAQALGAGVAAAAAVFASSPTPEDYVETG